MSPSPRVLPAGQTEHGGRVECAPRLDANFRLGGRRADAGLEFGAESGQVAAAQQPGPDRLLKAGNPARDPLFLGHQFQPGFAGLLVLAKGSALAPFIYTIF